MSVERLRIAVVMAAILLVPSVGRSQDSNSATIAGVARDASGGVLPGVTVEAASPALIEKVRVATTDGDGRFRIIDLRPGEYVVTFTLTGFRTLRRDGIQLTTGFTATVNGDLSLGGVEET
ncbi:MAG: Outer rane receptor for ferrienterochelin and colicin, partial [Acidobacteria bacterium]|nr:Outer rane receptor for ferrienterochelin and colicin [Acidobacteriota bacterium]